MKKGYKLKQGQIVTGKERLPNGKRPKYIIIDEFDNLSNEEIQIGYASLNKKDIHNNCIICGTKKDSDKYANR